MFLFRFETVPDLLRAYQVSNHYWKINTPECVLNRHSSKCNSVYFLHVHGETVHVHDSKTAEKSRLNNIEWFSVLAVIFTLCLIGNCELAMIPININISTIAIMWIYMYLLNLSWRNSINAEPGNVQCITILICSPVVSGLLLISALEVKRSWVLIPRKSRYLVQNVWSTWKFSYNEHNDRKVGLLLGRWGGEGEDWLSALIW